MMDSDHIITAETICDALGRRAIADAMGVTPAAVSNYSASGIFPAKWYIALRSMCDERGIQCPDALFNFVSPPVLAGEVRETATP